MILRVIVWIVPGVFVIHETTQGCGIKQEHRGRTGYHSAAGLNNQRPNPAILEPLRIAPHCEVVFEVQGLEMPYATGRDAFGYRSWGRGPAAFQGPGFGRLGSGRSLLAARRDQPPARCFADRSGLPVLVARRCGNSSLYVGNRSHGSRQTTVASVSIPAARRRGRGAEASWNPWNPAASDGNQAFDEYRAETLRRMEVEQQEFAAFVERLRFARDKAEFDQFMAERRAASGGTGPGPFPRTFRGSFPRPTRRLTAGALLRSTPSVGVLLASKDASFCNLGWKNFRNPHGHARQATLRRSKELPARRRLLYEAGPDA